MFTTDKDLRKAVPKRNVINKPLKISNNALSSTSFSVRGDQSGDSTSIVEIAKKDREQRAHQREMTIFIIRIQSWWRSKYAAHKWYCEIFTTLSAKFSDIDKVYAMEYLDLLPLLKYAFIFLPEYHFS